MASTTTRTAAWRQPAPGPGLLLHYLGRGPGALGVEHRAGEPDGEGGNQERHPELPAGNQLQVGHLLGDPDLKGIDGAEGGTDQRGAQAHRDGHQGREAEPPGEEEEDGNESDQLLFHLDQHAAGREREAGEGDDQQTSAGERADHGVHQPRQRAGPLDDRERPADQEDVEDDQAGVEHPLGDRGERIHGVDGRRRDRGVAARDDEAPAGDGVFAALVPAGGKDPGQAAARRIQLTSRASG